MVCYGNYGGSGAVAAELGKQLADLGHQVHFISDGRPFRLQHPHANIYLHQPGHFHYPVFSAPPSFLLEVTKILEVVKTYHLDLLHVHYAIPHCLSAIFARQVLGVDVPIVTTLHGTDITLVGQQSQFYHITKYGLENSDAVTAVSVALAKETKKVFKLPHSPRVIYNFVDTKVFTRQHAVQLPKQLTEQKEKVIIHISNFRPIKRVGDVITIFDMVNKRLPSQLILVGDGPDMPVVRERVQALGLKERVHFLGQLQDIIPLLSIADVLLLPSQRESFGLAALEAMACGVPVVASNVGGLPEVVPEGKGGYLLPWGDHVGMAARTLEILCDPWRHRSMQLAARQWVESNFAAHKWVNIYLELYHSLIAGRK